MHEKHQITRIEVGSTTVVLRVEGQLDAKTTPDLLARCQQVREAGRNLVLNLSEVSFIASSGIGGLLALVEDFSDAGLGIRYAALSPAVESVIGLLNLGSFLTIDEHESDAISALAA